MKTDIQSYKGVRDFYPEDQRLQNYLFKSYRKVVKSYGYEHYEASVLEYLELYKLKSQANLEILKDQIYAFVDRSQRQIALRPEMTPTLARMIAARQQSLSYPIRWYSIPNLFRYERPQKGRLREHWQLNVDILGLESYEAELELILIARDILANLGASEGMYKIHISSRPVLEALLKYYCQITPSQIQALILLIDRFDKISPRDFKAQAQTIIGLDKTVETYQEIINILKLKNLSKIPTSIASLEPCQQLLSLIKDLDQLQFTNVELDFKIVRGFDYYTGIVFEIFDADETNRRSMFGGGRYNNLLEVFSGSHLSGVGFGMGDVTMIEFLKAHKLLPSFKHNFDVYIILLADASYTQAWPIIRSLQKEDLITIVDNRDLKPSKKLETALKRQAQHVLFIGAEDLKQERFNLKHLPTSREEQLSLNRIITKLSSAKQ